MCNKIFSIILFSLVRQHDGNYNHLNVLLALRCVLEKDSLILA